LAQGTDEIATDRAVGCLLHQLTCIDGIFVDRRKRIVVKDRSASPPSVHVWRLVSRGQLEVYRCPCGVGQAMFGGRPGHCLQLVSLYCCVITSYLVPQL